jgi:hypothetical protein
MIGWQSLTHFHHADWMCMHRCQLASLQPATCLVAAIRPLLVSQVPVVATVVTPKTLLRCLHWQPAGHWGTHCRPSSQLTSI